MDVSICKEIAKHDWLAWVKLSMVCKAFAKELDTTTEKFEREFLERHDDGYTIEYKIGGVLHRFSGPAMITQTKIYYYKFGKLHRTGGPAVMYIMEAYQKYTFDHQYHKRGLDESESYEYYLNGLLHRIDGPASVLVEGHECYYNFGKLHRLNGPAVIRNRRGHKREYEYHIYGYSLTARFGWIVSYSTGIMMIYGIWYPAYLAQYIINKMIWATLIPNSRWYIKLPITIILTLAVEHYTQLTLMPFRNYFR